MNLKEAKLVADRLRPVFNWDDKDRHDWQQAEQLIDFALLNWRVER